MRLRFGLVVATLSIVATTAAGQSGVVERDLAFTAMTASNVAIGSVSLAPTESGGCVASVVSMTDPGGCHAARIRVTAPPASPTNVNVTYAEPVVTDIAGVPGLDLTLADNTVAGALTLVADEAVLLIGGVLTVPPRAHSAGSQTRTVSVDLSF